MKPTPEILPVTPPAIVQTADNHIIRTEAERQLKRYTAAHAAGFPGPRLDGESEASAGRRASRFVTPGEEREIIREALQWPILAPKDARATREPAEVTCNIATQ